MDRRPRSKHMAELAENYVEGPVFERKMFNVPFLEFDVHFSQGGVLARALQ